MTDEISALAALDRAGEQLVNMPRGAPAPRGARRSRPLAAALQMCHAPRQSTACGWLLFPAAGGQAGTHSGC